jgi:putative ABC transport system permease protein
VGLVSIPGMMTGQVLAQEDPLTAARYQIMVMCMMFGSSGLSASICLTLMTRRRPDSSGT